jgi:AraC-like DNA-binding protein
MTSFFHYQNGFQLFILCGAFIAGGISASAPFVVNIRERQNIFLILFIASLGMNNLSNYMLDIGFQNIYPIIPLLPLPITVLIPISFYFYLQTIAGFFRLSIRNKILIYIIFAELAFYLVLMTIYFMDKELISANKVFVTKLFQLKEFIAIFLTVILAGDSILTIYQKVKKKSQGKIVRYKWAKVIFAISMVIVLAWTMSYVYGFFAGDFSRKVYYPIWGFSTFVICLAGWHGFIKKSRSLQPAGPEGNGHPLPENEETQQLVKLEQLMIRQKLYKQTRLTVKKLADLSCMSSSRITKLLKQNDKNFNSFVNHYRIEEAKKLLLEQDYFRYTMDFICEEAGFNSRASFFTIFKAITGKTPKQYRDEMALMATLQQAEINSKEENLV